MILWIVAIALILVGLFVWTQGAGPSVAAIGGIMALILLICPAHAHDHSRPDLNEWLPTLHSKSKTWCCDGNDHDPIDDWETKNNRYRVKFRGEWYDVPEDAIVDGPNRSGDALLWMNKGYIGMSVRCFMPGSMT